ncbi:uncharacterized protein [Miscanthus floridulus]|uniref:uncharacterized protein n=1 Tax=Miscanthus floridulus TaxID=154761 RepID=UPI00345ABB80
MACGARGQSSGSQQKRENEIPGGRGEDGEAHQGGKGVGGGSEEAVRAEGRSLELGDGSGRWLRPSSVLGKRENESGGQQGGAETARGRFKAAWARWGARSHDAEWGGGCGLATGPARSEREVGGGADRWGQASAAGRGRLPSAGAGAAAGLGAAAGPATPRRVAGLRCRAGHGYLAEQLAGRAGKKGEESERAAREKGHAGRNRGRGR